MASTMAAIIAAGFFGGCGKGQREESSADLQASHSNFDQSWKDPQSCRACHEEAYQHWLESHHAVANRPYDPALDDAAFSIGEHVDKAGRSYRISLGPEGPTLAQRLAGDR